MPERETRTKAILPPTRRGLSRVEAAGYVGVSPTLFDRMVADGVMPQPKRAYGRCIYDVRQVDLAIDSLPGDDMGSVNPWDD